MSLYLDLMGNNEITATVSIRRLGLPVNGFGMVFVYEITQNSKTVRGSIRRDDRLDDTEDLRLLHEVLTDYLTKAKEAITHHDHHP